MVQEIPFEQTDNRRITLNYKTFFTVINLELRQLEVLRIIKALKTVHNNKLATRLINFILQIDKIDGLPTDFERKLPRRELED